MAQYFTNDFADFPASWTERYNAPTTGVFSVVNGNLVLPTGKSGDVCARTWDVAGTPTDVEVLVLITAALSASTERIYPVLLRGGGADEATSFWTVDVYGATGSLRVRGTNGTSDIPASIGNSIAIGEISTATPYWIRLKVSGTGDYYLKAWFDGQAEPETWGTSGTSTAGPSAGGWVGVSTVGLGSYNAVTIHQLGVGTNGDAAPASAPSSGASATISVTDAGDTSNVASTTPVYATIALTDAGDVSAVTGQAPVAASVALTDAGDSSSVTGSAGSNGNIRLTLGMQRERGGYAASMTSLKWCVFNANHTAVIASGTALTTDANGNAVIDVNGTSYAVGDYVPVLVTDYNAATAAQDRVVRTFFGFVPAQAQP